MRSISSTLNAQGAHQSLAQCFSTLQANNYMRLVNGLLMFVSSSGFLVLVTVVVTGQRRFGAGHMNQMFDRMQRAQQDSYGENRLWWRRQQWQANWRQFIPKQILNLAFPPTMMFGSVLGQKNGRSKIFWTGWNDNFIIGSKGIENSQNLPASAPNSNAAQRAQMVNGPK